MRHPPDWLVPLLLSITALVCWLPGCAEEADPATYGVRHVAVSTVCPEPHRSWAIEAVPRLDALGREAWRIAVAGDRVDVTVLCREFSADDPMRRNAVGSYQPGDDYVEFDPTRARDSFSTHAVVMHELIHQRVGSGTYPQRASVHVCRLVRELPAGGCYDGWYGEAVMNPAGIADGRPGPAWDDVVGTLSLDIVYPGDRSFYRWATGR